MKTCTKCQEIKDSTEFYSSKRDGLMPSCKVCHSKVTKAWKESNPDKVKLLSKKWDKLNAGKRSKTTRIWGDCMINTIKYSCHYTRSRSCFSKI